MNKTSHDVKSLGKHDSLKIKISVMLAVVDV